MVENCCKDIEVVVFFNDIVFELLLEIDKRISKDMLYNIINLFLYVCLFLFVKDVI